MNAENKIPAATGMPAADFQRLLAYALQSLSIQQTLLSGQMSELTLELRSLERDEELELLDAQLTRLRADFTHYQTYVDPDHAVNLE